MANRRSAPPWNFLLQASKPSLESYELSRLNSAANLRREISALIDQWIEDNSQALLARWVRDCPDGAPCGALPDDPLSQQELPLVAPLGTAVADALRNPPENRSIRCVRRVSQA